MGSIFFRDFKIMHRRLGISDMVTIEGNPNAVDRVRFNQPLSCIRRVMLTTSRALPLLPLEDHHQVIWLDYECRVNSGVLADVEEVVGRCAHQSVAIFTVNAERLKGDAREQWLSDLGEHRPDPQNPTTRANYALLAYGVLRAQIDAALHMRNAALPSIQRVEFRQMFHMIHSDNAQMLTVGGAIVRTIDRRRWYACRMSTLGFVRSGASPFQIDIPILTRREVQHLRRHIHGPSLNLTAAALRAGVPAHDAQKFLSVYRHVPLFVESDDW